MCLTSRHGWPCQLAEPERPNPPTQRTRTKAAPETEKKKGTRARSPPSQPSRTSALLPFPHCHKGGGTRIGGHCGHQISETPQSPPSKPKLPEVGIGDVMSGALLGLKCPSPAAPRCRHHHGHRSTKSCAEVFVQTNHVARVGQASKALIHLGGFPRLRVEMVGMPVQPWDTPPPLALAASIDGPVEGPCILHFGPIVGPLLLHIPQKMQSIVLFRSMGNQ